MKISLVKRFAVLTVASVATIAMPTFAQQPSEPTVDKKPGFQDFDLDGDAKISVSESKLNQWLADNFTIVDADKDGFITREEYSRLIK